MTQLILVFWEEINFLFFRLKITDTQQGTQDILFPIAEIKDYNFMIDGKNAFTNPVKNDFRT